LHIVETGKNGEKEAVFVKFNIPTHQIVILSKNLQNKNNVVILLYHLKNRIDITRENK